MSAPRLYRALLRSAKQYDGVHSWRRAHLLAHGSLRAYPASLAGRAHGRSAYFLDAQTDSAETKHMVQQHFRREATDRANAQMALNHGFQILRALNGAPMCNLSATSAVDSFAATPLRTTSTSSPSATPRRSPSPSVGSSSSGGLRAPIAHRASGLTANAAATTLFQQSQSTEAQPAPETGCGPALRRKLTPRSMECGARASILGRLHNDIEFQKPRTPGQETAQAAAAASLPRNQDSQYLQSIATLSVYAEEYLKQISAPVSSNATSGSTEAHALFLIDQSRLKHQQRHWLQTVTSTLSPSQQQSLESHVSTLGHAVQSGNLRAVRAFQSTDMHVMERQLAGTLLANNAVLDAWLDFLYAQQDFPALIELFKLRLAFGVGPEYAMSRKGMCKVLCAAAIEGDLVCSMQVLRESSWGALSSAPAAADAAVAGGRPSSANKLPSWVPSYYSSEAAAQATRMGGATPPPRTPSELLDGPDSLLARAAEEYTPLVEKTNVHSEVAAASSSIQRPSGLLRPTPSYRPPSFSSFSTLLGGSLLQSSAQQSVLASHASMSTRARPRIAPVQVHTPPTAPTADQEPTPPTPLPVIDLCTELSLDSRLMELALISSIRSESRAAEFALRDEREKVQAQANANPMVADHPELNISMHEHAAALLQAAAAPTTKQQPALAADSAEPKSIFSVMNEGSSPMAFQLWSLMLAQQVPLSHSNTYVSLLSNLQAHLGEMPKSSASLLLQTLSSEMQFARTSGSLKHKFLRSDVNAFLTHELATHQTLAAEEDGADAVWSCISTLRQMQQESVTPSVVAVAHLYHSLLSSSEPSFGRNVLLQEVLTLADDFQIAEAVVEAVCQLDAPASQ